MITLSKVRTLERKIPDNDPARPGCIIDTDFDEDDPDYVLVDNVPMLRSEALEKYPPEAGFYWIVLRHEDEITS